MATTVGFVGLGNMGAALAENLVLAGHDLVTHDLAGPARSPEGASFVAELATLARRAEIVVLSLPDAEAVTQVVGELVDPADRTVTHVVDTSTVGPEAAGAVDALLTAASIGYVDAPVSGGPAGARDRTLTVMYAGRLEACEAVDAVLVGLSDRRFRVGALPGTGQAMKLANNFLSATALAATSEAIAFGTSVGLDMATMLEILNASSGRSTATSDKFVDHVLSGRYASGFANTLMAKDMGLYVEAARAVGAATTVGEVTALVWTEFAEDQPGADFTRIHPFTERR